MATAANFLVLQGDFPVTLGDGDPVYTEDFDTPDYNGAEAFLTLMVRGLTAATSSMRVEINSIFVGEVFPYRYAATSDQIEVAAHQYSQSINVDRGILSSSSPNTIRVTAVGFPGNSTTNAFDNCELRDVFLLYQVTV